MTVIDIPAMPKRMLFRFAMAIPFALGLAVAAPAADKKTQPTPAVGEAAAFTESSAAGLAATNRVAITGVTIMFQAAAGDVAERGGFFQMLQSKQSSEAILAWPDMDFAQQEAIAAAAYEQLKTDLAAAGYEVLPESQVKASPGYQPLVKSSASPNPTRYANKLGDVYMVSPNSLPLYLPYGIESGLFAIQPTSYIGWSSGASNKSITKDGPSALTLSNNWKVPGLEAKLAQELNAHVVKATYVVTLGKTKATRKSEYTGIETEKRVSGTGEAYAETGLLPMQTRISFRAPNGSGKWQKSSMTKLMPPKDGDVSVRLANAKLGGTEFFTLVGENAERKNFLGIADENRFTFLFTATLRDPKGYKADVSGLIAAANKDMLALVKR